MYIYTSAIYHIDIWQVYNKNGNLIEYYIQPPIFDHYVYFDSTIVSYIVLWMSAYCNCKRVAVFYFDWNPIYWS